MHFAQKTLIAGSLLAVLGLAACGVRGPLELPPETKDADISTSDTGTSDTGTPGTKSDKGPHRSFILDGLLR